MAQNFGKAFEQQFKSDFQKIPNASVDRIYDVMSGYKSISNISDYICYVYPHIYYIEVKSIKGASFPIHNLTQYQKLKFKVGIKGVRVGVVIWYWEKDRVVYVPISSVTRMLKDGKKSIGLRSLDNGEYEYQEIPSIKKRTFMTSDYSVLLQLPECM